MHANYQPSTVTRSQLVAKMTDARERTGRRRLERTVQQAWDVRRKRNEHAEWQHACMSRPNPRERLNERILSQYVPEIVRRSGETTIDEEGCVIGLRVVHRHDGLALLGADGWRYYSRRFGARPASLRYLCGVDDAGKWAVRVPGACSTVSDAIAALEPAEVVRAREQGRRILRQGDIYAVELKRDRAAVSAAQLPESHSWVDSERTLYHVGSAPGRVHAPLHVPFPAKFVRQSALQMGRTAQRGAAD